MERDGLWRLFLATGLPEVYLAIRQAEKGRVVPETLTAFLPKDTETKNV